MNNYMECFDEILSAAEKNVSEEQMRNIFNKEEIKECLKNKTFRGDLAALFIAKNYGAGINAAKDIIENFGTRNYPESISFFVPLLSGKNRGTAKLSCVELAENAFGLTAMSYGENTILGYNSMLYMFIAGDCAEAIEKFLDVYMLMGNPDDSLSGYIRIAAKRRKTEMIKLFTKRGFTVTENDLEYLYDMDAEYADILVENEIVAVHCDTEECDDEDEGGDIQRLKNWTIKTDIDKIEVSGNVYDSQRGFPDGRFHSFEASCCAELNDEEFIVCENGVSNNNSYILRYDERLNDNSQIHEARLADIFEFCKNNTADYEKIAELLLADGDQLVVPGIGYTSRTIQKGEPSEGKPCYKFYYHLKEKTMTRTIFKEKKEAIGLPTFRKSGRDFYMCFDLLAEIFDDIMNGRKACEYAEKIRKIFNAETGIEEKHYLMRLLFTCLRYYASEENYSETMPILKEYGFSHVSIQCGDSTEFVFDLLNAECAEARTAAFQRISFRPDLNVFSVVPFFVGNLIEAVSENLSFISLRSDDVSKIICWLAEKRDVSAVSKLSRMYFQIKDTDLFELALRSPETVYNFLQGNFDQLIPDNMKRDGVIKSIDEMINALTYYDISDTSYFSFISQAYTYFDKIDFEFIISRMPKIKSINGRALNEIYRNEINYMKGAYDGKPEIAFYFDKLFSETVKIDGSDFAVRPTIKNEMRSKLTNHRFIVNVYHLNDMVLDLPKNFDFELSRHVDTEKFLKELVKSENRKTIIGAIRHNFINDGNVRNIVEYAVENHYYSSLKTIYKVFNLKGRKS